MSRRSHLLLPVGTVLLGASAALAATSLGGAPSAAPSLASTIADDAVVLTVGAQQIAAGRVRRAVAGSGDARAMDPDGKITLSHQLDRLVVREALWLEAARQRGAEADRAVKLQTDKALAAALLRRELRDLRSPSDVPAQEVATWFAAHAAEYGRPERVRLAHLVVATLEEAQATLAKAKADVTREGWARLVAEVSLDGATKLTAGDLGLVTKEGRGLDGTVQIHPELAAAAFGVKDGELVPHVVHTSGGYHVVWRRGSAAARPTELSVHEADVRRTLLEQKRAAVHRSLVDRLRDGRAVTIDEQALSLVKVDVGPRPVASARTRP